MKEAEEFAKRVLKPFLKRKKILFACKENACRSQMAYGFARFFWGDKLDVLSGGTYPAEHTNPLMREVMAEKSIDMAYLKPKSIDDVLKEQGVDVIFTMGCEDSCVNIPQAKKIELNFKDPSSGSIELMRRIRDEIEKFIKSFDFDTL